MTTQSQPASARTVGAGLRIAEAMALEVIDLSLDAEPPTLRVSAGKGNRSRIVPMHLELQDSPVDGVALDPAGGQEG